MSAIQLSDVIAVQALYKFSLNFIFHSSGDFKLFFFFQIIGAIFFMLNHYTLAQTNFLMNCKQKIYCRLSLFASSKINFTIESNRYFKLSV